MKGNDDEEQTKEMMVMMVVLLNPVMTSCWGTVVIIGLPTMKSDNEKLLKKNVCSNEPTKEIR